MFSIRLVIWISLALLSSQALAQLYQPREFNRPEQSLQLELEEGFDAFGERRVRTKKELERQSTSWKMFGRLGLVSVEKDDGLTLKRGSGPKLGRLTFGIRKRF